MQKIIGNKQHTTGEQLTRPEVLTNHRSTRSTLPYKWVLRFHFIFPTPTINPFNRTRLKDEGFKFFPGITGGIKNRMLPSLYPPSLLFNIGRRCWNPHGPLYKLVDHKPKSHKILYKKLSHNNRPHTKGLSFKNMIIKKTYKTNMIKGNLGYVLDGLLFRIHPSPHNSYWRAKCLIYLIAPCVFSTSEFKHDQRSNENSQTGNGQTWRSRRKLGGFQPQNLPFDPKANPPKKNPQEWISQLLKCRPLCH